MSTTNYNFSFTKSKNILTIQRSDKTKPNTLDINTMTFYSEKGNALKSPPVGLITALQRDDTFDADNVLYIMHSLAYNGHLRDMKTSYAFNPLLMADRLASVGYNFLQKNHLVWEVVYDLRDIVPYFSAFLKAYNADKTLTIHNYLRDIKRYEFIARISKLTSFEIPKDMMDMLYDCREEVNTMSDSEIHLMLYYLIHDHVYDYYIANNDLLVGSRDMIADIKRYFRTCAMIGVKPEKDYFKHSLMVFKTYAINAKHYADKAVADHNSRYDFLTQLNDDKFTIIIPKTVEEFRQESRNQQNCVYTTYLPRVQNGSTNVIFIRRTENVDASYITCEICNNTIQQYLGKYNSRPIDADAIAFKSAIQELLNTMA